MKNGRHLVVSPVARFAEPLVDLERHADRLEVIESPFVAGNRPINDLVQCQKFVLRSEKHDISSRFFPSSDYVRQIDTQSSRLHPIIDLIICQ